MAQRITVSMFEEHASNTLTSKNVAVAQRINMMAQRTAGGSAKVPLYLRTTPGLTPECVFPDSPGRCVFQQDGRAFTVYGGTFFEYMAGGSFIDRGNVDEDDYLASICSNGSAGNQLLIVSGGKGYVYDLLADTLGSALGGDFPANVRQCLFTDGYGFVFVGESRHFQISALEDFTSWDALDFGERSIASDNIISMLLLNRTVWFLGSKTTEGWYDSGDALFPFQPIPGTLIGHGSGGAFGAIVMVDQIVLLGLDEAGSAIVWRLDNNSPTRISTTAVELDIANAGAGDTNDFALTVAWTYQEQGQDFFVLQCPSADKTWVYDKSTGLWHNRLRCVDGFDETTKTVGNGHMYFGGKHLVMDRLSGALYEQSLSIFNEQIVAP